MYKERKLKEFDIKWFNTCCMCCARCISYGTGECNECCDVNDVECENCMHRNKQMELLDV